MKKKCCICKQELPIDCFKSHTKRKDGLQSQCIECQREYRRNHYLANRAKYIGKAKSWRGEFRGWWKEYKKRFVCEECGESHPACITFHHHNDDKEACVSQLINHASKDRVLKEISKCTPLCANCHAKRHYSD